MRKVFLSLAALAFVATGSLTMTSCGGDDDSTPVNPGQPGQPGEPGEPGNPGNITANNSFVYNGVNYEVNNAYYVINSLNPDAGDDAEPEFATYNYGTEENPVVHTVSEWYLEATPTFSQGQQPTHFIRIYFDVVAGQDAEGQPTLKLPNASTVLPYQVMTIANGAVLSDSEFALGEIDMTFNVFALQGDILTTAFNGKDNVNNVNFDFNGQSGLILDDWNVPTQGGKSPNSTVKLRKDNLNNANTLLLKK